MATPSDTINTFLQALTTLYSNADKSTQEQANAWLEEFQKTPEAWSITDTIIRSTDFPLEPRVFAAQIFRTKVTYDLHQLDLPSRISLRDSLLDILRMYKGGPKVIITYICLSLAGLALQLPEWTNVLAQLVDLFGSSPDTFNCLLEFVAILPEEVNGNSRIPLSHDEYKEMSNILLGNNAGTVLDLLVAFTETSGASITSQRMVFKCLQSWLKSGDIPINRLASTPLFKLLFEGLKSQDDDLFEIAVDSACEVIHETRETDEHVVVIQEIYSYLMAIRQDVTSCSRDDTERLRGYCRLYTEAAEIYCTLIAKHPQTFNDLVNIMLECTAFPDLDIVPMTFNFWYCLKLELVKENHLEAREHFAPVFEHLVQVMIKHLHYPFDLNSITAQEMDDFRSFRHTMGDVLKDCCNVLTAETCLNIPYTIMKLAMEEGQHSNKVVAWQNIEAPLFSLRAMGSEVPSAESTIMPQIMLLLPTLPNHPKIRYAGTLVVSRYSEWTAEHPEFLPQQLPYISGGFDDPDVAMASAMALKYLCKDSPSSMTQYLNQLVEFYQKLHENLSFEALIDVVQAVAYVVASVPKTEVDNTISVFCEPMIKKLEQAETMEPRNICNQIALLDTFISEFSKGSHDRPDKSFVERFYPIIDRVVTNFSSNESVMERICSTYRHTMEAYGDDFLPFLPSMANRIVEVFEKHCYGCCLYAAQLCVRVFGNSHDPTTKQSIFAFVERLATTMLSFMQQTIPEQISGVIEDFFHLMTELLRENPETYLNSPLFSQTFKAGLSALSLTHYDPLRPVLNLYEDFIKEVNNGPVAELYKENVSSLSSTLFSGMLGGWSIDAYEHACHVLKMMTLMLPDMMESNLQQIAMHMSSLPGGPSNAVELWSKLIHDVQTCNNDPNGRHRVGRIYRDFVAVYRRGMRRNWDKERRTSSS